MPNKTKVATFVRVSNHTNSEQALANQKRMLDEYCQAQGYEIEDTAVMVGDKNLGYEMFLKLIDEAEERKNRHCFCKSCGSYARGNQSNQRTPRR